MLNISLGYYMQKDKIYRLVGVFFTLTSIALIFFVHDSKIESVILGIMLGVGLGMIGSGKNAFAYWKLNKT